MYSVRLREGVRFADGLDWTGLGWTGFILGYCLLRYAVMRSVEDVEYRQGTKRTQGYDS